MFKQLTYIRGIAAPDSIQATGCRARDGFLRVPIQAPGPAGGRVSDGFLRVLGAAEPLVGAQVLEVLPRRVGGGRGRGGLLPEADGVLGVEHSIDHRTVCETEVVARLPALDQYVWRGGQAERPLGGVGVTFSASHHFRVGPKYLREDRRGLNLEEGLFPVATIRTRMV